MAKVSTSALNAKELGLLRADDKIVFHAHELLHIAKAEARALAESGYRPPLPARQITVAGDVGIATFKMLLVNMLEGRFISPYDNEIAERIATILCGGKLDRGALVDEEWPVSYTHLDVYKRQNQLKTCDLIIEAIAERMDWKQDLYKKIAAFVPAHTVLASNTSGLGINALASVLPEELRHRFCGVHFFNPPR